MDHEAKANLGHVGHKGVWTHTGEPHERVRFLGQAMWSTRPRPIWAIWAARACGPTLTDNMGVWAHFHWFVAKVARVTRDDYEPTIGSVSYLDP